MNLEELRKQIDKQDKTICKAITKRFEVVKKIAKYKKENRLPIVDKTREKKVLLKVRKIVGKKLASGTIENIYKCIIKEAVKNEKKIKN